MPYLQSHRAALLTRCLSACFVPDLICLDLHLFFLFASGLRLFVFLFQFWFFVSVSLSFYKLNLILFFGISLFFFQTSFPFSKSIFSSFFELRFLSDFLELMRFPSRTYTLIFPGLDFFFSFSELVRFFPSCRLFRLRLSYSFHLFRFNLLLLFQTCFLVLFLFSFL